MKYRLFILTNLLIILTLVFLLVSFFTNGMVMTILSVLLGIIATVNVVEYFKSPTSVLSITLFTLLRVFKLKNISSSEVPSNMFWIYMKKEKDSPHTDYVIMKIVNIFYMKKIIQDGVSDTDIVSGRYKIKIKREIELQYSTFIRESKRDSDVKGVISNWNGSLDTISNREKEIDKVLGE